MEGRYTCLRCLRALTTAARQSTRIKIREKSSIKTHSFATLPNKRIAEIKSIRTQSPIESHPQHGHGRSASTVAAYAQEADNLEGHNQSPDEHGQYRAHPRTVLRPDKLFHPFSKSPIPEIRLRAAFTKQHAYCPHPVHQQTRVPVSPDDPEGRKLAGADAEPPAHVQFECPDCGIATYCSEEHWADDYEAHLEICDTLRQINEDDHDLRSGRWFPEFDYPGPQIDEILANMTSWDTFLYTRGFEAINEERSMRQVTRLLTYPLTVGSILHELSPYNIRKGGRLTVEGLKSLSGQCR